MIIVTINLRNRILIMSMAKIYTVERKAAGRLTSQKHWICAWVKPQRTIMVVKMKTMIRFTWVNRINMQKIRMKIKRKKKRKYNRAALIAKRTSTTRKNMMMRMTRTRTALIQTNLKMNTLINHPSQRAKKSREFRSKISTRAKKSSASSHIRRIWKSPAKCSVKTKRYVYKTDQSTTRTEYSFLETHWWATSWSSLCNNQKRYAMSCSKQKFTNSRSRSSTSWTKRKESAPRPKWKDCLIQS